MDQINEALDLLERAQELLEQVNNTPDASVNSHAANTQVLNAVMNLKQSRRSRTYKLGADTTGGWAPKQQGTFVEGYLDGFK
jgi:hypothetical protein